MAAPVIFLAIVFDISGEFLVLRVGWCTYNTIEFGYHRLTMNPLVKYQL